MQKGGKASRDCLLTTGKQMDIEVFHAKSLVEVKSSNSSKKMSK